MLETVFGTIYNNTCFCPLHLSTFLNKSENCPCAVSKLEDSLCAFPQSDADLLQVQAPLENSSDDHISQLTTLESSTSKWKSCTS